MALSPQIEALVKAEDRLISETAEALEAALSSIMDQALQDFERNQQLIAPRGDSLALLLDTLAAGWKPATQLGVEHLLKMEQKQDNLTLRAALEYLNAYGVQRTRQIVGTTASQLTQIIVSGQRQGLSVSEIMQRLINRVPTLAATRAKIIAETEIHSAVQFGAYNAALRSTRLLVKVWNTVEDDRVRDFRQGSEFSHVLMQGVKKPLDIPFAVPHSRGGTEALRFPGDPEGSAGNIINCRCAVSYEEP